MEKITNKKMGIAALSAILLLAVMVSIVPVATADHSPGHKEQGGPPSDPGEIMDCDVSSPITGGIIDASIRVPDGETCYINSTSYLNNLVINGNVIAGSGSMLFIETMNPYIGGSITINGDVKSDGGDQIRISGISMNPVYINGDVQIKNTLLGIVVTWADITGSAQFENNEQYYSITNTIIGESVQVKDNTADDKWYESIFAANTISGNLQCKNNDPAPQLGMFGANTVSGKAQGQCSDLA